MNKYGTEAQTLWNRLAPTAVDEMEDSTEFFTNLGDLASGQVAEMTPRIAGPDSPQEGYLEKVGRLNAARNQAEEIVRAEVLMPPADVRGPDPEDEEDDSDLDPNLDVMLEAMREQREISDHFARLRHPETT